MPWLYKACLKCGGDLEWHPLENVWHCLQCAQEYTQAEAKKIVEDAFVKRQPKPIVDTLPPVPPKPTERLWMRGANSPMHDYYERNRKQITYEALTYGERATIKRWGLSGGQWTTLKRRWGLPINQGKNTKTQSVLPARIGAQNSGL